MQVAVLGSGSWGTALTILLARNGHGVTLYGRDEEEVGSLRTHRENLHYLPGFAIPEGVEFRRLEPGPIPAELVVVAVPAGGVREVLRGLEPSSALLVITAKGLEAGTGLLLGQVAAQARPEMTAGALSGPNLAVELARGVPTTAIAAFQDAGDAEKVRDAFMCATYRVSTGDDVVGVELAGALKNVLAIGAGLSDGLGFGDNTKGAFLSRGLMEMARLGRSMGARTETFLGPAGVGDLFATAASQLSRNYRVGRAIAAGAGLGDAVEALGQVAEGVPTSEAVQILAKRQGMDMPVFSAVEAVLKGRLSPSSAVAMLMERTPPRELLFGDP